MRREPGAHQGSDRAGVGAPAEAQGFDQVPQLVRGITAGLLMLGQARAPSRSWSGSPRALGHVDAPEAGALAAPRLDRLADAIVSVEYYMETLQAGRRDPGGCSTTPRLSVDGARTRARPGRSSACGPARVDSETAASGPPPRHRLASTTAVAGRRAARCAGRDGCRPSPPALAIEPRSGTVALFIEEARENVATPRRAVPAVGAGPTDAEALRDLRRAFHTLEGQRPHGRRAARRRVRVGGREPAEPRDQPDPRALAGHRGRWCGEAVTRAAAARRRARARDHGASTHRGLRARRCAGGGSALCRSPKARCRRGCSPRARPQPEQRRERRRRRWTRAARHLPQGDRRPRRASVRDFIERCGSGAGAVCGDRGALSRLPHAERDLEDGWGAAGHQGAEPMEH